MLRFWQRHLGIIFLGAWMLSACQTASKDEVKTAPGFVAVSWDELGNWADDGDAASLLTATEQSLAWVERQDPERRFVVGGYSYTVASLRQALIALCADLRQDPRPAALPSILARHFDVLAHHGSTPAKVMATGYYVPMIEGSLTPDPAYPIPVRGIPIDLITVRLSHFSEEWGAKTLRGRLVGNQLMPYWTRKQLRAQLPTSARPIAWVKDEFALFVIEIQGSGILRTPDGKEHIISYAEQNGHPYRAVGRLLLDEKKIPKEKMSMHAIKEYVAAQPADLGRVLEYNPSVVFFRLADKGVVGNLNVPLTPGRSVATDQKSFPPGLPLLLNVSRPSLNAAGEVKEQGTISRVVMNQDVGGAIRGASRVDFFWGAGERAEAMASIMQHEGTLYVLLPRMNPVVARGAAAKTKG